ncbi:regulatory protein RecX [Candidatus Gottesmanbacteria bacterium]|nr:regulatory protein RecX [Candidatus Gottesmanbacteria bacterium]
MRVISGNFDANDLYQKLLESSIRFVSFRLRSEKEFRDFLLKKLSRSSVIPAKAGIQSSDAPLIDRVLTRLRELGYVDDAKFVSWWVDQRKSYKPKGVRLIAQELKAKGISDDLVQSLLVKRKDYFTCGRSENSTDDEVVLARRAVERKLPLWNKLPKLEQKRKLYGFLGRRGFDSDTIQRVILDSVV